MSFMFSLPFSVGVPQVIVVNTIGDTPNIYITYITIYNTVIVMI